MLHECQYLNMEESQMTKLDYTHLTRTQFIDRVYDTLVHKYGTSVTADVPVRLAISNNSLINHHWWISAQYVLEISPAMIDDIWNTIIAKQIAPDFNHYINTDGTYRWNVRIQYYVENHFFKDDQYGSLIERLYDNESLILVKYGHCTIDEYMRTHLNICK